ncbi:hypothetical protein Tco_0334613 [Tanacetum coccineum]
MAPMTELVMAGHSLDDTWRRLPNASTPRVILTPDKVQVRGQILQYEVQAGQVWYVVRGIMIGSGSELIIGSLKEASRRGTWQRLIGGSRNIAAGNHWDTKYGTQGNYWQ